MRFFLITALSFLVGLLYAQSLSTSLTACYNMNGNVHDAINNLHGAMNVLNTAGPVSPSTDTWGAANSALHLTGTNYAIDLPNDPLLKPSNNITFSAWVKFNFVTPLIRIVFTKNTSSVVSEAYQLAVVQNAAGFRFRASKASPTATNNADGTSQVLNNTWYHVAFTMDNSNIKLYVNVTLEATTPVTFIGYDYAAGKKVTLGTANEASNNGVMTGDIDNVKFYNRVLNATEINQLITINPPCYISPPLPPDCKKNLFYTITNGSIYAYRAGTVFSPTVIPIVLPANAYGLAVGPAFGFSAPDPTYWTTAGGTLWYFDGTNFVNTNHSTGTTVANIGGSKNRIYIQNNVNGDIYYYTGTGNSTFLKTIITYSAGFDIIGDDLDNFYLFGGAAWQPPAVYNSLGTITGSWTPTGYPYGSISGGVAIIQNTVNTQSTTQFYVGKFNAVLAYTPTTYTTNMINDFANCYVTQSNSITSLQGDSICCDYPNLTLVANSTIYNYFANYNWAGPGIVSTSSNSATINQPGVYSCTVTSLMTGQTAIDSISIYSSAAPLTISLSPANALLCLPSSGVTFTASGATNYTWNPASNISSTVNPVVTVNPPSNQSYTVTGTTTGTCAGSSVLSVTVGNTPIISINLSDSLICANAAVTMTMGGASAYTVNGVSTGSVASDSPGANTIYTVTGISPLGCIGTATTEVKIDSPPLVSVSPTSITICAGDTATLVAAGASTYSWSNGATGATITVTPTTTLSYIVTGASIASCTTISSAAVGVWPVPTVLVQSSDSVLCEGNASTLTATGATTYSWTTGDFTPIAVVSPTITTSYTVWGTNGYGCKNSAVFTQSVSSCIGVVENSIEFSSVSIFPNPGEGEITIRVNGENFHIEICSSIGQKIYDQQLTSGESVINIERLDKGLYFLRLSNSKSERTYKIVVY